MLSPALRRRPAGQLLSPKLATCFKPNSRPHLRSFHASAPRKDPLLDSLLYLPHEAMNILHTSMPWYAVLPTTAFVLRAALVTTAGSWARALMARYVGLHPLRQALAFHKRHEVLKRKDFRTPQEAMLVLKKETRSEIDKLDKRWNVTLAGQVSWTLAQIPIFFAMAEVIRQKCSARDGLLGMATHAFRSDEAKAAAADAAGPTSVWFEPSLATEGILWFPDLLIPDPTGVLPFIASGLMFTNIYMSKNTIQNGARWPGLLRKTLLGVSLLVGPLCQDLPAALMLYWASSTSSVMIWNAWLDWRHPTPEGFTACKRPLLMFPKVTPRATLKGRRGKIGHESTFKSHVRNDK